MRNKKEYSLFSIVCLLIGIVILASVLENNEQTPSSADSPTSSTELPRIISLAPHITELLFAVGAGPQIVATVGYSDYPEPALDIPRIGSYNQVNYEALVSYQPDLVMAWESGNGLDTIGRLKELGLSVFSHEPRTLDDVAASLAIIGELSGHPEEGKAQSDVFKARLQQLREDHQDQMPVSVYYQLWNEPQMTVNAEHLISDVIRLCGGKNIFADAAPLVPKINIESVLRRNPQVIIASGMTKERPVWLDDWKQWPSIRAVKNDQLAHINPDIINRHSPRILDGASDICRILAAAR